MKIRIFQVAKNLVLGGVRHVTVQDTKAASYRDLASQYFLTESDVTGGILNFFICGKDGIFLLLLLNFIG